MATVQMPTIQIESAGNFKERWGTQIYDYRLDFKPLDFQDLMIAISINRAKAVEGEVKPLSTRMKERNAYLQKLGTALSEATSKQAEFKSDDAGDKAMSGWFTADTSSIINSVCPNFIRSWSGNQCDATKAGIEGIIAKIKNVIDGQNNESQRDMTRLQSLVDRRDESFSTATTLMTSVSDTRSNAIRNL